MTRIKIWIGWFLASYRFFTTIIFTTITIVNFVIFVGVAFYLGGDAVNGKAEGGHYYLYGVRAENGHKVYTEVSEAVFNYSKWHVYSILVTWPLMMAAAVASKVLKRRTGTPP